MRTIKKQGRFVVTVILMFVLCLPVNPVCIQAAENSKDIIVSRMYTDQEQGVAYLLCYTDNTCIVHKGNNKKKKITIPKEIKVRGEKYKVIGIDRNAFEKCNKLEIVNMSEGIKEIGDYAFSKCSKLRSVNIPKSVIKIGRYAFSGCSSLEGKIVIPKGIKTLSPYMFNGCSKLKGLSVEKGNKKYSSDKYGNIYNKDKTILKYGSPFATSVKISKAVKEIDACAFKNCRQLKSVSIASGIIQIYAFQGCNQLYNVKMVEGVKKICNYAFSKCSKLKGVEMPETLTEISNRAFEDCSSLEGEIVISKNVKTLGEEPFYKCMKLKRLSVAKENKKYFSDEYGNIYTKDKSVLLYGTPYRSSVKIPEGVKEINGYAFNGCENLKSVEIPKTVTSIGGDAFAGCSNLEGEVVISKNVKLLCGDPFFGCVKLERLSVEQENKKYSSDKYGNIYTKDKSALLYGTPYASVVNIPKGVLEITEYAFERNNKISSVNIPEGVEKIGEGAFKECTQLTAASISGGAIGSDAFKGCTQLTNVSISGGTIGSDAFRGCTQLTNVSISGKKIGSGAFGECIQLTSISISEGIKEIGVYAFYKCGKLSSVEIPKTVTQIGSDAFKECSGLEKLSVAKENKKYSSDEYGNIYDKDKTILLYGSPYAKEIIVSEGVTEIGSDAFEDNKNLKSINLPKGLKVIGRSAFQDCSNLEGKLVIPKSVQFIYPYSFQGCIQLKELSVEKGNKIYTSDKYGNIYQFEKTLIVGSPYASDVIILKGTKKIDDYAFAECSKLKSVKIPEGVEVIEDNAFELCSQLSHIYIPASVQRIGYYDDELREGAFIGANENLVFHVKKGSYAEKYVKKMLY